MEKESLKIYVVTNKTIPILNNDLYIPFQVGIENDLITNILRDNKLENISHKNQNFSELTAAYWLWKNNLSIDNIGLCHYRRYFNIYSRNFDLIRKLPVKNIKYSDFIKCPIVTKSIEKQKDKIMNSLNNNFVIIPKPIELGMSIYKHYGLYHPIKDFEKAIEILEKNYPKYKKEARRFFYKNTQMSSANMFISSKQFWNSYHEWLFNILFELEKNTEISQDNYQRRIFGFISERLFNLYIKFNNIKTKEFETLFIDD